jgi:DNA primase
VAGLIRADVVAAVKEQASIEDVVRDHVTLRPGGVGSLKGLCPFHDEKTPSFQVRPHLGVWHCFGCSEGGDVISFVQRVDHLTFTEAVERLADKAGIALAYEEGGGPAREEVGRRGRLIEASRVAEHWYAAQLAEAAEALPGRRFLAERGFDRDVAARFAVGYAPRSGEALLKQLRGKGFTDEEIIRAGLAGRGQRGPYDRFRGRLVWPIHDITGDCVGFGARRIYDDDRIEAKYLNTSDTPLFKKSQVLYGLDLAKKVIATGRQVVVVEGYTDVMACHLAGVGSAVATCGTAFGTDHIKVIRRIMRDDESGGQVVFTFDGDAAGQKAAMRAYEQDHSFGSPTYVAVEPDGLDPCELRQRHGDQAVRDLIATKVPSYEFAIRTLIGPFDLDTVVGRHEALKAAAPVVARLKASESNAGPLHQLAGLAGVEIDEAKRAVQAARRTGSGRHGAGPEVRPSRAAAASTAAASTAAASTAAAESNPVPRPNLANPVVLMERQLLQCLVQAPGVLDAAQFDALGEDAFEAQAHRLLHGAVRSLGGLGAASEPALGAGSWVDRVAGSVPDGIRGYVTDLAVSGIPVVDDEHLARFGKALQVEIADRDLARREGAVRSRLQRLDADRDAIGFRAALVEVNTLVKRRTELRAGLE